MVSIRLENVTHAYEKNTRAVKNINWEIPDGSATGLLGPSGCGKTTLMNIISGLLRQTEGNVYFGDQEVTDLIPQKRNVCMVFQFPVVYAGMSVYDNLAFPLKNRGVTEKEIKKKVKETADFLGLTDMLDATSTGLGPGDKQLVSLGRAIVRGDPNAILLDEPLTDVEPDRRLGLRRLLKQVQKDLKYTMIYVTHDQTEALTFSDRVAVMREGEILQYAGKDELVDKPKHPYVGYFIGSPGMNFLSCSLSDSKLDFGEFTLKISEGEKSVLEKKDTKFKVGIRPEVLCVSTRKREGWIPFKCDGIEFRGNTVILILKKGDIEVSSTITTGKYKISEGDNVWVSFPKDKIRVYNSNDKLLI